MAKKSGKNGRGWMGEACTVADVSKALDVGPKWRDRIVGHGKMAPGDIVANPFNFRVHSELQKTSLGDVIKDVGFVRSVTVNRRSGHLIDGHLRVMLALERGETSIRVEYVDLSPQEERAVIASLDPLSALATVDQDGLDKLLADLGDGFATSRQLLEELAGDTDTKQINVKKGVKVRIGPYSFQVAERTFKAWARKLGDDPDRAVAELRRRLKLD